MPKKPERRLSEVFSSFVAGVIALGGDAVAAVADAVTGAIGEAVKGTERVVKGATFVNREVDVGQLAGLAALLPRDFNGDVRDLHKGVADECARRGDAWTNQCLASTLEDLVVKPLREAIGAPAGDAPKAAKTKGKK